MNRASGPRVLAFAGSARAGSFNKKLVRVAARGVEAAGVECTLIDLRDYPMPIYDGDLEDAEGIPPAAMELKRLMLGHQGLLLACPEYNSSITGVLKNSLDWASRLAEGESSLQCFRGKVVSLLAASPGSLGGLRGLVHVRAILGNLGCIVLPDQLAVNRADQAFDAAGLLQDQQTAARLDKVVAQLVSVTARIAAD